MQTRNIGAVVELIRAATALKIRLRCTPGPLPLGPSPELGKGQYLGIGEHMVLTVTEDRYLPGLLAFQADCPATPDGQRIYWVGGVACQPWQGDLWYRIHPLFIRDVDEILAGQLRLNVAAVISCVTGIVTDRPYWLLEIPALTRAVLLHLDQIVIVRRRRPWKPGRLRSKTVRGDFWQTAGWRTEPPEGADQEEPEKSL
ncbi:MAG: hypothetical protein V2A79_10030 [Planctomycetota bacterium]